MSDCECQNCDWKGDDSHTEDVQDLFERVPAGEEMPAGECPECGALCLLADSCRLSPGVHVIAVERVRQQTEEGWTDEHDDTHTTGCLAVAGASYALGAVAMYSDAMGSWPTVYRKEAEMLWPFNDVWFNQTPDDPVRQLTKAGAMIAAEIDRLLRRRNGP